MIRAGASLKIKAASAGEITYALELVGLTKTFKRQTIKRGAYTTIKSAFLNLFSRSGTGAENVTRAIQDLTIRIPQGAAVGVIGRNGSGKSTLLKLITGIYKPTSGRAVVHGRLAALIELGAGFHPDFTGRENLYLGGVMHGLSREEIAARFQAIVSFAELEDVIDDPIRTYSSGMFMRLGFSLAIHTDPDILLIDEVLAVGDAAFVSKCKERIAQLKRAGKTLMMVSHDLEAVERWCDEVVWLNNGKVMDRGEPRRVIDAYRQFVERGEEAEMLDALPLEPTPLAKTATASESSANNSTSSRWGSREIEILGVRMLDERGELKLLFHPEDKVKIEIAYRQNEIVTDIVFGIALTRSDGLSVHGSNTSIERVELPRLGSSGTVSYYIDRLGLLEGNYSIDVAAHREDGYPYDYHKGALNFAVRQAERQVGVIVPPHRWEFR